MYYSLTTLDKTRIESFQYFPAHLRLCCKTAELPAYRGSEPVSGEEPARVVYLTPRRPG